SVRPEPPSETSSPKSSPAACWSTAWTVRSVFFWVCQPRYRVPSYSSVSFQVGTDRSLPGAPGHVPWPQTRLRSLPQLADSVRDLGGTDAPVAEDEACPPGLGQIALRKRVGADFALCGAQGDLAIRSSIRKHGGQEHAGLVAEDLDRRAECFRE